MKPGRPKEVSPAARERMKKDSCEKCRFLTTKGFRLVCTKGREKLLVCDEYKDVSRATPRLEGGIIRLYQY